MATVLKWLQALGAIAYIGAFTVFVFFSLKLSWRTFRVIMSDTHWDPVMEFGQIHRAEVRRAIWRDRDGRCQVLAAGATAIAYLLGLPFDW